MKIPEYRLLFHPQNFVDGTYFDIGYDIHDEMYWEMDSRHVELKLHITIIERPRKETAEYADGIMYRPPHPIPHLRIGSYLRIVNVEKEGDEYDGFEGLYVIFEMRNSTVSAVYDLVLRKVDSGPCTILMREYDGTGRTCYFVKRDEPLEENEALREWKATAEITSKEFISEGVIRCRNCKYYLKWYQKFLASDWCLKLERSMHPDGFCFLGEIGSSNDSSNGNSNGVG